jgi:hypothetical protein
MAVLGTGGGIGFPFTSLMAKGTDQLIDSGVNGAAMGPNGVFSDADFLTWHLLVLG